MSSSWKTTLCGLIGAVGTFLAQQKEPAWLGMIGQLLMAIGSAAVGIFARDNDKSSEDVGAK